MRLQKIKNRKLKIDKMFELIHCYDHNELVKNNPDHMWEYDLSPEQVNNAKNATNNIINLLPTEQHYHPTPHEWGMCHVFQSFVMSYRQWPHDYYHAPTQQQVDNSIARYKKLMGYAFESVPSIPKEVLVDFYHKLKARYENGELTKEQVAIVEIVPNWIKK